MNLKFTQKVFVFRNKYFIKAKILKAIQNFGKQYINSQTTNIHMYVAVLNSVLKK